MNNTDTIGNRLRALREEHELSVTWLAQELGCSRGSIIRWERDRCLIDTRYLLAYMEYFGVSADWILKGDETET